MPRGNVPPELQHLTVWEDYARLFIESDLSNNVTQMANIWRQAHDLAYHQRREIPEELWPQKFMRSRIHFGLLGRSTEIVGKGVYSTDIGAWLKAMSQWSRTILTASTYRR